MIETVRWTEWDGSGLEHCALDASGDAVHVESTVVGGRGGVPYGAY